MKRIVVFSLIALLFSCYIQAFADEIDSKWLESNYIKTEAMVRMRDGVSLYTAVFSPKDTSIQSPVIYSRTPYSISPYGEGFPKTLYTDLKEFVLHNYIIVLQNVRGRYLSEGEYENLRPYKEGKVGIEIDEASDAYDTIEWILHNTRSNGAVGAIGYSYPGFYATMAALSGHPALKAVSPQAPILDWYKGDDMHHNGVFMLLDTYSFGGSFFRPQVGRVTKIPSVPNRIDKDVYTWFLEKQTISNVTASLDSLPFWNSAISHPDYDSFWQERSLEPYLKNIKPAVLVVGGEFDTDDCYGAVNTYRLIKENSPETSLHFVYGPWNHGGWRKENYNKFGEISFPGNISSKYLKEIEFPFFRFYLEGKGDAPAPASVFFSGTDAYEEYSSWPPVNVAPTDVFLTEDGILAFSKPSKRHSSSYYVSDPAAPVPYVAEPDGKRYRAYMLADQTFAISRPDVLTYSVPVKDTLRLEGPVDVQLYVSTTSEDADFVVKLIDVAPDGYAMLVRGDVFRARYREGFSDPKPMRPGKIEEIGFRMCDVAHILLPGHSLMVQVQSSWFPIADLNPQTYVENIYYAVPEDFQKAGITIYHQKKAASKIVLPVKVN